MRNCFTWISSEQFVNKSILSWQNFTNVNCYGILLVDRVNYCQKVKMRGLRQSEKGVTLAETLCAVVIFTIGSIILVKAFVEASYMTRRAEYAYTANNLAKVKMEELIAGAQSDFGALAGMSSTEENVGSASITSQHWGFERRDDVALAGRYRFWRTTQVDCKQPRLCDVTVKVGYNIESEYTVGAKPYVELKTKIYNNTSIL